MSQSRRSTPVQSVWLAGSLLLIALTGCGGTPTYAVSGKIIYKDGTPMPGGGQIVFEPTDPAMRTSARGNVLEDGTFRMGTFSDTDGVPEGKYRVSIQPTPPPNRNRPPAGWPPLQKKYMHHTTSNLEITVTRSKNTLDVTVEK